MGTSSRLALMLITAIFGTQGPPGSPPGDDSPEETVHTARCPRCKKKCEWQSDHYYCSRCNKAFTLAEKAKPETS
jgi:hypothetical protein